MRNTFGWEKQGISRKNTLIDTWDVGRLSAKAGDPEFDSFKVFLFVCWFINPSVYIYNIYIIYI